MDKFLELPFWLSVTLGVVYGVVWLSFLVVVYSSYKRYHRRHQRVAMHYGEDLAAEKSGAFDSPAAEQSESVYDDDDD